VIELIICEHDYSQIDSVYVMPHHYLNFSDSVLFEIS